jgi:hypothetical protein
MAEAFAKVGVTATPDPGSVPPTGDQPSAATTQAQPETPPVDAVPTPEQTQGPIPFANHKRILDNARAKTEQEVSRRFQEQYAPHVEFGEKFRAAPVETLVQAVNELAQHPEMGPQVISALARTLGSRRGQGQPVTEDAPQADLQTADGSTRLFSEEQQLKREAYLKAQWMKEVDQRISPLQQREQAARAHEQREQATKDANTRMSKVLEPFKALPEFAANKQAIAEKTQALMGEGHDPQTALGLAVATVLREVVLPSRAAQSRNDLVAQAVAKSTGSTTAPGTAPAAPSTRPTSMADAFARIAM